MTLLQTVLATRPVSLVLAYDEGAVTARATQPAYGERCDHCGAYPASGVPWWRTSDGWMTFLICPSCLLAQVFHGVARLASAEWDLGASR